MPSRMALVLRGDAYDSYLSNEAWTSSPDQGDPLWGALARVGVGLAKKGIGAISKSSKAKKVLAAGGAVVGAVTAGGVGMAIEKYVTKRSGATAMPMVAPGSCGAKGYHVIRRGPNAGKLTRNRRMRVTNPKALRRAIRRASGFARLAKKVMKFTSPRGAKGRAYFKAPRRKKF
jgi:hypothetical protein